MLNIFVGMIGSSHKALIGLDVFELSDIKIKEGVRDSLDGKFDNYENIYHLVTAEKSTPLGFLFAPVKSANGNVIGGVVEDVTEHKMSMDFFQKSNEELEAANEELVGTEEFEAMNEELIDSSQELIFEKQKKGGSELAEMQDKNFRKK